ncbi:glycosyltransferase [Dysgonomonas macrotermitis]|uniref:Glycosyltransferase, catalytic subunit of cellulose synthase and poly-beta-1,6-N-acetylglucosamine synthase n=1 Tax=Dysgonomonas macrotermitis TaxID=1346286 RepID=A0A1M5BCZ0_9BACT|nr:glycosyltransferase [Dysgonomonas macrotermitis]SHF40308.1 Glycosyltransferase, catalytic subunit of cellulose synthase and poly-beta-1,6-N-acetylglucosamine synthase [Dysgonomonas macrotermitis]
MEQFISSFTYDLVGIIILLVLLVLLAIQIYFYLAYYKKPLTYYNNNKDNGLHPNTPSVSVIIIGKDESQNLEKCLPEILNQDYPNFEVIVVNEGATDETEFLLKKLKREYSNLYSTFSPIPDNDEDVRNKVLPLTIGIKAARKDILLFTEADSIPVNNQWIRTMVAPLNEDKQIALGYSRFKRKDQSWANIAVFDNLIFSLQYLSSAIKHRPFAGTYRNIAYRKQLFFDNKGFSASLNYNNAELIFVNQIMDTNNTVVILDKNGYVSTELQSYNQWREIKTSYYRGEYHFSKFTGSFFSTETTTRYLFYILTLGGIAYSAISLLWAYLGASVLLFLIRYITQVITLNKITEHFETPKYRLSLPMLELLQPYINSGFVSMARSRKRKRK